MSNSHLKWLGAFGLFGVLSIPATLVVTHKCLVPLDSTSTEVLEGVIGLSSLLVLLSLCALGYAGYKLHQKKILDPIYPDDPLTA